MKKVKSSDKISDKNDNASYMKNVKTIFLAVLLINVFVLRINLTSQLIFVMVKMHLIYLLEEFLKSMIIGGEWKKNISIKL